MIKNWGLARPPRRVEHIRRNTQQDETRRQKARREKQASKTDRHTHLEAMHVSVKRKGEKEQQAEMEGATAVLYFFLFSPSKFIAAVPYSDRVTKPRSKSERNTNTQRDTNKSRRHTEIHRRQDRCSAHGPAAATRARAPFLGTLLLVVLFRVFFWFLSSPAKPVTAPQVKKIHAHRRSARQLRVALRNERQKSDGRLEKGKEGGKWRDRGRLQPTLHTPWQVGHLFLSFSSLSLILIL